MGIKEERLRRKLVQREEKNMKYAVNEIEASVKSLEEEVMALLKSNLNRVLSQYIRWKTCQNSTYNDRFADYTSVWAHWLHYDIQSYQKKFEGIPIHEEKTKHVPIRLIKSAEQFWNSFNVYDDITPLVWRIRFTVGARLKLLKFNFSEKDAVLRRLINFGTGYINPNKNQTEISCKLVRIGPCENMAFYSSWITDGIFMIFCVELNRFPYVNFNSLLYYSIEQHIKVIDFQPNRCDFNYVVSSYLGTISNNPDLYLVKDPENCEDFRLFDEKEPMRKVGIHFFPIVPSKIYLSSEESASMKFNPNLRRWDYENSIIPKKIDMFSTSHPLISKLASEEAGSNFVKLLTSIPNFKIRLTEEQNEAVKSTGNVVVFGRSGTGKTTCAVLRMFASELLFKFSQNRKTRKFGPEDVKKTSFLHSAFVTASPVLTNEVKRFYSKLNDHVKIELEKKIQNKEMEAAKIEDLQNDEIKSNESASDSESDEEKGPVSMNLLKDDDFPLFFTVRRLIFMIDASLRRPFFARDINGKVIGAGSNYEWHNEFKGSLKISKDYKKTIKNKFKESDSEEEEDDEEEMNMDYDTEMILKYYEEKRKNKVTKRSFEVDYSIFKDKFWPKIKNKTHFSSLVIWTEITAYIKGSSTSFMYSGYYLPKTVYANKSVKVSLLSREEKNDVWDLFILYERWKVSVRAYDFQDIVNYILSQVKYYGYTGIPIHYMMVDEVQDLTPATIALLIMVTKQKLMFSGDTAQTIAKGVGFRFCDLEGLFYESELKKPVIHQLTLNFRTHNQILAMANSIVSLLETLFPQTIDKMAREISNIEGPVPKLICSSDHIQLFYLLFGCEKEVQKSEAQFGCNQVIIVRDQEAKKRIHPLLSHALCLTVFEAKGLEFDDVVLYNFFTDSEVSMEKWKVLSTLKKQDNYFNRQDENTEKKSVQKLKALGYIDQSRLSILCTELKHLYVAVTRPKKNLIIFDESVESRRHMQDYWDYMGVIRFVKYDPKIDTKNVDYKAIARKTSTEAWKIQGERMMSHKFYDQAAKCFSVSGDEYLEKKALALAKATQASLVISAADAMAEEFENTKPSKKVRNEVKENREQAEKMFKEAAEDLLSVHKIDGSKNILKQAAQCFASGKEYLKAAQIFEEVGFLGQAAESYASGQNYEKAAEMFNDKGEYVRAIECYSFAHQWEKIIHCINKHKNIIPEEERKKYVYKYMPIALEALIPKILPNEQSNYMKKILEEQKNKIEEVKEEEEDED